MKRQKTRYHQFSITAPREFFLPLVRRLAAIGSMGAIETLRSLIVYFPLSVEPDTVQCEIEIAKALLKNPLRKRVIKVQYELISETDWNASWKRNFKPLPVGKRFAILPPWEKTPRGRIPLIIDPGMAFGTGHHETTRSCLFLMEKYAGSAPEGRFLDLGTGTGLLAIAARKIGFRKVVGVDTDPLSIAAARKNRALNKTDGIVLRKGSLNDVTGTFNMIAANLIAGTLIELAPAIADRTSPSGIVIISGILKGQDKEVANAARRAGLNVLERCVDGKWVSLALAR